MRTGRPSCWRPGRPLPVTRTPGGLGRSLFCQLPVSPRGLLSPTGCRPRPAPGAVFLFLSISLDLEAPFRPPELSPRAGWVVRVPMLSPPSCLWLFPRLAPAHAPFVLGFFCPGPAVGRGFLLSGLRAVSWVTRPPLSRCVPIGFTSRLLALGVSLCLQEGRAAHRKPRFVDQRFDVHCLVRPVGAGDPDVQVPAVRIDLAVVLLELDGDVQVRGLGVREPRHQPPLGQHLDRNAFRARRVGALALPFGRGASRRLDASDLLRTPLAARVHPPAPGVARDHESAPATASGQMRRPAAPLWLGLGSLHSS